MVAPRMWPACTGDASPESCALCLVFCPALPAPPPLILHYLEHMARRRGADENGYCLTHVNGSI